MMQKATSVMLPFAALLVAGFAALIHGEGYGCSNNDNTDRLRDIYLNFHNNARRRVAKGEEPNKEGKLNPAKNMYKLSWNCEMEKKAQEHIKTCTGSLGSFSYGQSLMSWQGSFSNPERQINQTLNSWWGRVKQVGLGSDNKYTSTGLFTFASMVYAKTTEIGCAHKVCPGKMTVFCLYNQVAYFMGEVLWETGHACTKPEECTTYKATACDNGLCVKGLEKPDNGSSSQCATSGMTDAVRNKFLEMHNQYRSLVANGKAEDGKGGTAPQAARMPKLKYECEVEAIAMKHAQKCKYAHSSPESRPGLGENMMMVGMPDYDKTSVAQMASELWFGELKKNGVGQENAYTWEVAHRPGKAIGHYTQMVWDNTKSIGCAVESCPKAEIPMTLVVCNYKTAGNYLGSPIYEKGTPCSKCPRGVGCQEGLCLF